MNGHAEWRSRQAKANREKHELPFARQLDAMSAPKYEREYRFAAVEAGWNVNGKNQKPMLRDRLANLGLSDWRFDFAWPDKRIAFEIEGAPGRGRHTTFIGFSKDCEKYNAATRLGWAVYRVTGAQVKDGYAMTLAEEVLNGN